MSNLIDKTKKKEILKSIEKILDNATDDKKTVVMAMQTSEKNKEGEGIEGAAIMIGVTRAEAAKIALLSVIEHSKNKIDNLPEPLKNIFEVMKKTIPKEIKKKIDHECGNACLLSSYRKLLHYLLGKEL